MAQQVEHVRPPFHDDDLVALVDGRSCGQPVLAVLHALHDADGGRHLIRKLLRIRHGAVYHLPEKLLCAVNDHGALADPDVLDVGDLDLRVARADALDDLKGGADNRGLRLVKRRGDDDCAGRLAELGRGIDLYAADPPGALQLAQLKVRSQEPFGLPEDGPDDIRPVHGAVDLDRGVHDVF